MEFSFAATSMSDVFFSFEIQVPLPLLAGMLSPLPESSGAGQQLKQIVPNKLMPYAKTVVMIGLIALLGEVCVGSGAAYHLVFGWTDFLQQTLPKVRIR